MSQPHVRTGPELKVWDLPVRLFHWLLVAAVAVAFLSSDEDSALGPWHQAAGWVAAVLIAFRIVWGFVGGEHARFADFLRPGRMATHLKAMFRRGEPELGHNPLGGVAILILLGLVAATVASGVLVLGGGEDDLHEAVAYGLLAMIGVHVAAVLVMSFVGRENLTRAMVTGRKPALRHPGGRDARAAPAAAYALAAAAIAAAVFGAIRFDAQAFGPHARAEAREARDGGEGGRIVPDRGRSHEPGDEREAGR